jgi:hypothetical protein
MSIPTREQLYQEQKGIIQEWQERFMKRFGYDIGHEFGDDMMEWSEFDFQTLWDEQLRNEENEGLGL